MRTVLIVRVPMYDAGILGHDHSFFQRVIRVCMYQVYIRFDTMIDFIISQGAVIAVLSPTHGMRCSRRYSI